MKLFRTAYAHCDVPCGIYDPKPAQIAAATVLKMVQKMNELKTPQPGASDAEIRQHQNDVTRFTWTKEEHGRVCKEQILILWTDYFKPEHFEKFPDLTDKVLAACKLCSYNKQHVDEEKAQELVKAVDEIADIFAETKAASH
jgi:nickel superoxide dismutase